jgi:hypothetical protein
LKYPFFISSALKNQPTSYAVGVSLLLERGSYCNDRDTHPTDAKLLTKARIALVKLAKKQGVDLRQSYCRVGKASLPNQPAMPTHRQYI